MMTSENPELILRRFPKGWEAIFPKGKKKGIAVVIRPFSQKVVGLKIAIGSDAKLGQRIKLHLVQRCKDTREIVGGVAVQISVKGERKRSSR